MYRPKYTEQNDLTFLHDFAERHNFATLISANVGAPFISHLPLLIERREKGIFWGHLARANPHSKILKEGEVTVIFNGPHSYITPALYSGALNVPTWNYAVVHARCKSSLVEDHKGIVDILKKTVEHHEKDTPTRWGRPSWTYELPDEFNQKLVGAIVGFKLDVIEIQGKFKLSQNRNEEDFDGVFEAFKNAKNDNDVELFKLMNLVEE